MLLGFGNTRVDTTFRGDAVVPAGTLIPRKEKNVYVRQKAEKLLQIGGEVIPVVFMMMDHATIKFIRMNFQTDLVNSCLYEIYA